MLLGHILLTLIDNTNYGACIPCTIYLILIMKRVVISLYLVIISLLLMSCQTKETELKEKREFVFPTGYYVGPRCCGNFYDKDSNLFFYFAEPVSHKEIQIFNESQELVKRISLKDIEYIQLSKNIEMPCMDSIIITIGNPLQLIYVLDSDANVIYRKYLPHDYIKDSIVYEYGTSPPIFGYRYYNNGYIFIGNIALLPFDNTEEYMRYIKTDYKNPKFSKIKLDSLNAEVQLFGGYYDKVYESEFSFRFSQIDYKVVNNHIFNRCWPTNKVAVINCTNVDSVKVISLNSKYTTIGLGDIQIDKNDIIYKIQDKLFANMYSQTGSLLNVVWDNYRQRYYFFIRTKCDSKTYTRDGILQVFDKSFNFVKEMKLSNSTEFELCDITVTKEGLLINYNRYGKEENTTKKDMVYKLYAIDF